MDPGHDATNVKHVKQSLKCRAKLFHQLKSLPESAAG